jgi:hypothetical protein
MNQHLQNLIAAGKLLEENKLDEHGFKQFLYEYLATEEDIIPHLLSILGQERKNKKELLLDTNAELSRALVTILDENYGKKGQYIDRIWVAGEIKRHYLKWKAFIRCNFKIDGIPD